MYPTKDNPAFGIFIKEQIDSLKVMKINVDLVFINGHKSKLAYLKGCWQVFWRSLRNHYDLIHAHYGLSGWVARCQFKYPVVVSFCGCDVLGIPDLLEKQTLAGKLLVFSSKILSRLIDSAIVKTSEMKQKLKRKDAFIIPNGVDFELFKPIDKNHSRKKIGLDIQKKYALFPNRPSEIRKRVDIAQESIEILKRNGYNSELLIIANASHKMVSLYMNAVDVLVLTSLWEGSPNVIKEAMACNLPIVSVDVGDVREVIGDTEGCYIAKREPEDIARKIEFALRRNKRTDGRERIKHLNLENIAKKIVNIYREVINKRGCYDK